MRSQDGRRGNGICLRGDLVQPRLHTGLPALRTGCCVPNPEGSSDANNMKQAVVRAAATRMHNEPPRLFQKAALPAVVQRQREHPRHSSFAIRASFCGVAQKLDEMSATQSRKAVHGAFPSKLFCLGRGKTVLLFRLLLTL